MSGDVSVRKITFGGANSLDDYLARKDHAVDWLLWGDEIDFNIHPVLLGSGISHFHEMTHQINLELLECRTFRNGCVFVRSRVKF